MNNISTYSDRKTANTNVVCAEQRAFNLAVLGSKRVLELCVGPSLKLLESKYQEHGIECWGNDIDNRWSEFYKNGKWLLGDALRLDIPDGFFDTIVFAPPLSDQCSGRREDSLSLEQVNPSYYAFLEAYKHLNCKKVLVLPGRTLSLKSDKNELYRLLSGIDNYEVIPLKNKVTKYVDIYIK